MKQEETNKISDGYHTFGELYTHRYWLFIALLHHRHDGWKSKKHSDGTMFKDMFIAGIGGKGGSMITYHLPLSVWNKVHVTAVPTAPKWDGHTPNDVIHRLKSLTKE